MITADCPQCGSPAQLDSANQYRPFCCERCRLIDLGSWVNEEHKIAGREFNAPEFDGESFSTASDLSPKH